MPPFNDNEWSQWVDEMIKRGETYNETDYGKEYEHKLDQKFSRSKVLRPKIKVPEVRSKSVVPMRKKKKKELATGSK